MSGIPLLSGDSTKLSNSMVLQIDFLTLGSCAVYPIAEGKALLLIYLNKMQFVQQALSLDLAGGKTGQKAQY